VSLQQLITALQEIKLRLVQQKISHAEATKEAMKLLENVIKEWK
jgi:hypothetical protein